MRFKLLVYHFFDFLFLLIRVFKDVFGLKTGHRVVGFLYDLIEHFLLLLLDFEGLYFFLFFRTFHFFLDWTFLTLLNFGLFVNDFQSAPAVEKFLHFSLKVQIFVAFDGLVVLDSVSVKFDEIADDFFWWRGGKFKLDFIVEKALGEVWRQLNFMDSSLHGGFSLYKIILFL